MYIYLFLHENLIKCWAMHSKVILRVFRYFWMKGKEIAETLYILDSLKKKIYIYILDLSYII